MFYEKVYLWIPFHVYKNADAEGKNGGTLSSDFPLHFFATGILFLICSYYLPIF